MKTKSKNGRKAKKPTPDLVGTTLQHPAVLRRDAYLQKQQRDRGPALTASEIADSIETEIKNLQGIADILRGKA
jgi:hypothetical protein